MFVLIQKGLRPGRLKIWRLQKAAKTRSQLPKSRFEFLLYTPKLYKLASFREGFLTLSEKVAALVASPG